MAAPAKNRAPIIALSRALTGRAWNNKPPIALGQSQQTAPATAKMIAKTLISTRASPCSDPPLGERAGKRFGEMSASVIFLNALATGSNVVSG
jgi:hypothetical protein